MERRFCSLLPVNDGEHEVAEGPERIQLQGDHGRAAEGGSRQQQVLAHHRHLTLPSPHLGVVAYDCRKLQATAKVCLPSYLVMNKFCTIKLDWPKPEILTELNHYPGIL